MPVRGPRTGPSAESIASLPIWYDLVDGPAQAVVVSGADDWPVRASASLTEGVRAIIITDPGPASATLIAALAETAASKGAIVLLSEPWAGDPTVLAVADEWRSAMRAATTIEAAAMDRPDGADNTALVLRQLRVIRRLGFAGIVLRGGNDTAGAVSRIGDTADGAKVILFGVRSAGHEPSLDVVVTTPSQTVTLRIGSSRTARPAFAILHTPTGGEVLPAIYETADRATFVLMHEVLTSGRSLDQLTNFAEDVKIAQKWAGRS